MPTIVDMLDYIIALKSELAKQQQVIEQLQNQLQDKKKKD